MLVNTNPLFYVPFCHLQINDWEYKKTLILNLLDKTTLKNIGSYGKPDTIRSDFYNKSKSYTREIQRILESELNEFNQTLGFQNCRINDSWFESGVQSEYHTIHNHGPVGYSVVCYIEYDKKVHTPTIFQSPYLNFMNGTLINNSPKDVVEGDMIFFPSALAHYTQPSNSDVPRTILSFNLDII